MKYQRLTNELDDLLDLIDREEDKRQESLNDYFWRLRAEERKLRRKIENEENKNSRRKLKKKLNNVIEGYDLLGAHFNDSHSKQTD